MGEGIHLTVHIGPRCRRSSLNLKTPCFRNGLQRWAVGWRQRGRATTLRLARGANARDQELVHTDLTRLVLNSTSELHLR